MCKTCGCGKLLARSDISAEDGHAHPHGHPHAPEHEHRSSRSASSRVLTVQRRILDKNDRLAKENRRFADQHDIVVLNLISAPGSGKTLLLEKTLLELSPEIPCAVITGDIETDRDARRLENRGAWVRQIETHHTCHLAAEQIGSLLPEIAESGARILFIENVGNLVCPTAFDLGEHFKVAILSVTEGEDKPIKYPALFSESPVVLLTKTDLLPHLDYNLSQVRSFLRKIHPGVFVFEISARTGAGMDAWYNYLRGLVSKT